MIKLIGSSFQKKVWNYIKKIPKGEVRTYKEISIAINSPNSSRAIANACGQNPYPQKIPCHRVIRSDGKLGGYSFKGGVKLKRRLLKNEGIKLKKY